MKTYRNNTWKYVAGLVILTLPLLHGCEEGYHHEQIDVNVKIEGKIVDRKDSSAVSDAKVTFLTKSGFWTPEKKILTTVATDENGIYSANFTVTNSILNGRCHVSNVLFEVTKEGYGNPGTSSLGRYCDLNCKENIQSCIIDDIQIMKWPS